MEKDKQPGRKERKLLLFVSLIAVLLMAAGAALGLWSTREMREVVAGQFNEEQLVIARHVSSLIERQVLFLRKELLFVKRGVNESGFDPETSNRLVQQSFYRVLESGVWKIEIIDLENWKSHLFMPYKEWSLKEPSVEVLPPLKDLEKQDVWISGTRVKPYGICLFMGTLLSGDSPRLLLFELNLSWFLSPFLSDIRSGKTGYAWILDEKGNFIYHPNTDFVGKSAFEIREEKYPGIPLGIINFIQKEKMLQGEVGTGWFFSGWHRGFTGKIKKLIAYCPVIISGSPSIKWSVAVVAPVSEIEGSVQRGSLRLFLLQGFVIVMIFLGAAALIYFQMRWSRVLESRVDERTEELKKSEEKYRSLVESAEDFIFTVDEEGRFQSMNSFTASFFGGHPDDFLGKGLSSLLPEGVAQQQLKLVKLVFEVGKSARDEFKIEMGEHEIWINANFMPLKDREGIVNAVLCIARDITDSKKLERQLINTEKLASMGTLAAGVAHEVNNPLGVILGFSDLLLRKTPEDSQAYEDLKTIERQGLHCKQVVENLLSFARFGEGDSEYADVNGCLNDIIRVVKHTLEMHDIELVLSLAEYLPLVHGDSRQLQQVFLNLINNAVSAMPTGGTLWIRSFLERGTRKAVVQVEDDGIGIRAEDMDRIFEPFFTTKPEGEGTGLGLFVSYGIITKYGGTIDCVSHRGTSSKPGGTTFTIRLLTKT